MKLELIRRSMRDDYVCYGVKISEKKLWKIYLPRNVVKYAPERFVTFVAMASVDPNKHICHTCEKTYSAFQYQKHAKRYHK